MIPDLPKSELDALIEEWIIGKNAEVETQDVTAWVDIQGIDTQEIAIRATDIAWTITAWMMGTAWKATLNPS